MLRPSQDPQAVAGPRPSSGRCGARHSSVRIPTEGQECRSPSQGCARGQGQLAVPGRPGDGLRSHALPLRVRLPPEAVLTGTRVPVTMTRTAQKPRADREGPSPGCHHAGLLSRTDGETVRDRPLTLLILHLWAESRGLEQERGCTQGCAGPCGLPGATGGPATQADELRASGTQLLTGGSSTIS